MMAARLTAILALLSLVLPALASDTALERNDSPLIAFRILFRTGSAYDPAGKEGVASLTAAMLSSGGTKNHPYDEIVKTLFPMAASVNAQVDKEMTVFTGVTHVENLDAYYNVLRSMLLEPGWREDDFKRLKDEAINYLRNGLRSNNEEELGKEYLYIRIYGAEHPYGHENSGVVSAIEKLTLDDVKAFYAANYRQGNLTIGLSGGYPDGFAEKVEKDFAVLPQGAPEPPALPEPAKANKLRVHIIEKDTRSTLISLGFPLGVTRADPDWPALKVMQSYFGQHRSAKSHLFQQIRETRGMNYGDYAYIEYFPDGMFQFQPNPNLARRQQIFQIWIRPVLPENGQFALKIALYELDKLVREGLTQEDFDSTKLFLSKFVNLLTQTESEELGYKLDSDYYGIGEFNSWFKGKLDGLTLEQVNAAIKKRLRAGDLDVVVITKDAEGYRRALLSSAPAKAAYASPPESGVLAEDKLIGRYKLDVGDIDIVKADTIFEK